MAIMVSPGINITETDLTASSKAVSVSDAAFAGPFQWGPVLEMRNIASEDDLVRVFGKPDDLNAQHWFTAQAFLAYSNLLKCVRASIPGALNATEDGPLVTGNVGVVANSAVVTGIGAFTTEGLVAGQTVVIAGETYTINTVTNTTSFTLSSVVPTTNANTTVQKFGVTVENEIHFESVQSAIADFGSFVAKYPGELGNTLKISVCPSAAAFSSTPTGTLEFASGSANVTGFTTTFLTDVSPGDFITSNGVVYQVDSVESDTALTLTRAATVSATGAAWTRKWEFAALFDGAPGTSSYTAARGGANDELHVVVVDALGRFTGTPGTVLERYAFLSKALGARAENGETSYYRDVLNRKSAYVWTVGHPGTTVATWGLDATTTFTNDSSPWTVTLIGGQAKNASVTDAALQSAYDLFKNKDEVDISLVITGPASAALSTYIIQSICEYRGDCIAFISPEYADVVYNSGQEVADITSFRSSLPNSSYAFADSGWKYTYDKWNDKYRWAPLNGDIAGLAARSDTSADPWFSPAGFTRGTVKNAVKLAWNPKQGDRDDLYKIGINPVVSFPGQGIVLYGDKTLLARPSAFDRINVRRLFIILEKTIARLARAQLFEFNDEFTRAQFRTAVEPYLRDVQARRGLVDFRVVCDESNNTAAVVEENRFVGDIYIKPSRSINFIQLNFVAVRNGVSFQEVTA
jgi:hypothetical protein